MALVLLDRVQQTGNANTTVSFTLSGSVTGFQSFTVIGNGNTTYYSAFDTSGNWEVGVGTYATGGTLTRTTILSSSNSNTAVTFSGTVNVFVTYPAGKNVSLDASGNATALGTPASFVGTNITGTASGLSIGGNAATASNGGVTSIVAGTGISISGATGAVTVTNTVTSPYVGLRAQVFTSSGTFTCPTGVTAYKISLCGGGGAGYGYYGPGGYGGTSSFGSVSSSGGSPYGAGGSLSGCNILLPYQPVSPSGYIYGEGGSNSGGNDGGGSPYGIGWVTGVSGSVSVSVGAGGYGIQYAGAGTNGFVLVEW